jgi:hypothetical protein
MGNEESAPLTEEQKAKRQAEIAALKKRIIEKDRDLTEDYRRELGPENSLEIEDLRLKRLLELFPDEPPDRCRRFLVARQCNVENAASMFKKFLTWRNAVEPWNVDKEFFLRHIHQDRAYLLEYGESPILYLIPKRHIVDENPYKEVLQFAVNYAEFLLQHHPLPEKARLSMIVDCKGLKMKNIDMKLISNGIDYYQDYFPERLHSCFAFGLPTPLVGLWSTFEKLLDERTRHRIKLLTTEEFDGVFHLLPSKDHDELKRRMANPSHDLMLQLVEKGLQSPLQSPQPERKASD